MAGLALPPGAVPAGGSAPPPLPPDGEPSHREEPGVHAQARSTRAPLPPGAIPPGLALPKDAVAPLPPPPTIAHRPTRALPPAQPLPQISNLITKYSEGDPALDRLARVVSGIESGGGRNAVRSASGAVGIMQVLPETAQQYGFDPRRLSEPGYNVHVGMVVLRDLLKRAGGDPMKAVIGYNAGPGNMSTPVAKLPAETRDYIEKAHAGLAQPQPDKKPHLALPPSAVAVGGQSASAEAFMRKARAIGNPMDQPDTIDTTLQQRVQSGLSTIAGHQDIGFILHNAQLRDGGNRSIAELVQDPKSHVAHAYEMWKKNPGQAMDEYGLGSAAQNKFMAEHFPHTPEGGYSNFMAHHPMTNAAVTFIEEMVNPISWLEGGAAGRALGAIGKTARVADTAQAAAKTVGLGSPLSELAQRGGVDASQWAKGLIASVKHEDQTARKTMLHVFKDLTSQEQHEVVRLSQGLKPDPRFFSKYVDLSRRATALRSDVAKVTGEQVRVGRLKPGVDVYDPTTYFPMSRAYDFGPRAELIDTLRGNVASPGGGNTAARPKVFDNLDQSIASGKLDKDFSPALNYETWRRQRMQHVAFEDAMQRAPASLKLPATPATVRALRAGQGKIAGREYVHPSEIIPNVDVALKSPQMRRSLFAPELWKFLGENGQFAKYVDQSGGSYLPGESQSFGSRLVGVFRTMIVSNPVFHPTVNIAGNDAAARGVHGLAHVGGSLEETALPFETGGYAYNAAKALAMQVGLAKPERFVGGAKQYAKWMDRALKAGAKAEFGTARKTAMGGDAARVLSEPVTGIAPKYWIQRIDKAMQRFSDWNGERTFGDKGEASFTVSLFKDAVTRGHMSDAEAGQVVREALGDYYNFDPKSHWSVPFLFMPWLKSNLKFWMGTLVRRPQYLTGPAHAIRDYNVQQGDPGMDGHGAPPDFRIYTKNVFGKNTPDWVPEYITPPFVGRDMSKIANAVKGAAEGSPNAPLFQTESLLEGRMNPFAKIAVNLVHTGDAMADGKSLKGPETDYRVIWNPKAPHAEQLAQVGRYMAGNLIPVPLVSYAIADAMRRGMNAKDLTTAFIAASGAGYGSETLDEDQRRDVSRAQKRYLKAYYQSLEPDADPKDLNSAWSDYVSELRDAGAIH